MEHERPLLGHILTSRLIITKDQLKEALRKQMRTGKPLGRVLVELGFASEDQVCSVLGVQHELDTASLKSFVIPDKVIAMVGEDVIKTYDVVPIAYEEQRLTLAIGDVMNVVHADDLRFVLNAQIDFVLTSESDLRYAQAKYYQVFLGEDSQDDPAAISIEGLEQIVQNDLENTPVIDLVNVVLSQSIKDLASDIHFEPMLEGLKVRCRIDGVLVEMMMIPLEVSLAVTSRIKVMADMDIAETRLPQDGRIDYRLGDVLIDLRVATLPTIFGECIVIRVLDKNHVALSLTDLGLSTAQEEQMKCALRHNGGIILTTGPTGSGKTTSIYALLKSLNGIERKIMTVEDPIEYEVDGVIQTAVKHKIHLTFAKCLRHILRQDPDVLMIGEMRDSETVGVAVQSALTGHLVLSTLHTNDTIGSITRLLDMSIEPFLITSTVRLVVAQRLLRVLCSFCKEEAAPSPSLLDQLGVMGVDLSLRKFFKAAGCERCQFSGYHGRTGIFEILTMTPQLKELILEGSSEQSLRYQAQKDGMVMLRDDGLQKVFAGVTSLNEVLQQTQEALR